MRRQEEKSPSHLKQSLELTIWDNSPRLVRLRSLQVRSVQAPRVGLLQAAAVTEPAEGLAPGGEPACPEPVEGSRGRRF